MLQLGVLQSEVMKEINVGPTGEVQNIFFLDLTLKN